MVMKDSIEVLYPVFVFKYLASKGGLQLKHNQAGRILSDRNAINGAFEDYAEMQCTWMDGCDAEAATSYSLSFRASIVRSVRLYPTFVHAVKRVKCGDN